LEADVSRRRGFDGETRDALLFSGFLRLDRPELAGTTLVIRATSVEVRRHRQRSRAAPLAYLYEPRSEHESDAVLAAGHYDVTNQVWVFSGDITGISGLTQPLSWDDAVHHEETA
jgi:hypothetical protein